MAAQRCNDIFEMQILNEFIYHIPGGGRVKVQHRSLSGLHHRQVNLFFMHTTKRERSENDPNVKTIRVRAVFRDRVDRCIRVPEITISGLWLAELGFNYGKNVMLTVDKGSLLIQLME
jgi:hypothetical protein